MLKQRVLTAIVLGAVFIALLFFAPPWLWCAFLTLVCGLAAWEWGGLSRYSATGRIVCGMAFALLYVLIVLFMGLHQHMDRLFVDSHRVLALLAALVTVLWLFVVPLWLRQKWLLTSRPWAPVLVGLLVLLPPFVALTVLRHLLQPAGVLCLLALVWVADSAAYFSGRAFGRHKLAPTVSPGKTWEGAAGAVLGVLCVALLLWWLWGSHTGLWQGQPAVVRLMLFLLSVLLLVVISIAGDLFESLLKRQADIKDSSHLLPGHGGILDRIDSLTAVLPYALAVILLAGAPLSDVAAMAAGMLHTFF